MKQETINEVAERLTENAYQNEEWETGRLKRIGYYQGIIEGVKLQAERMYSKEEAYKIWKAGQEYWKTSGESITFEELIEQFKKK